MTLVQVFDAFVQKADFKRSSKSYFAYFLPRIHAKSRQKLGKTHFCETGHFRFLHKGF